VVVFDNTVLCLLLHPEAEIPNDPVTDTPVERAQDRMRYLVEQLREAGTRILIPAPVLAEFLTFADAEYLTEINQNMWFEIAPFDQRAAVEAAIALRRALASGQGKKLGLADTWQKIKIDRQLVAIAKVNDAAPIYTSDSAVVRLAKDAGIEVVHLADLPIPPEPEPELPFLKP
jgi:predicted nucleic acid-binding protein